MTDRAYSVRMMPIDFDKDGKPRFPKIATAVQEFARREFGAEVNFGLYSRVWAVLKTLDGDNDYFEVMGMTALRNQPDCPIFHIVPPTKDKDGLKMAMMARDQAIYRMHSYLEDLGMIGNKVLIYVSPEAQPSWNGLLGRRKIVPANRYELEI